MRTSGLVSPFAQRRDISRGEYKNTWLETERRAPLFDFCVGELTDARVSAQVGDSLLLNGGGPCVGRVHGVGKSESEH